MYIRNFVAVYAQLMERIVQSFATNTGEVTTKGFISKKTYGLKTLLYKKQKSDERK